MSCFSNYFGCEYCNGNKFIVENESMNVSINSTGLLRISTKKGKFQIQLKFCPMCGCRLNL